MQEAINKEVGEQMTTVFKQIEEIREKRAKKKQPERTPPSTK